MSFTSFNLSRFNSTFKRAMAALGYGTDSAIRARVLQEAQSNAVWARFAPSVAGYPSLPRVAGNIQIDEPAALTALAGSADLLSYTAPVFKVGNTMIPLTEFSWGLPFDDTMDGGIKAQFADDWGYSFEMPLTTWDTTNPLVPAAGNTWDTVGSTAYKQIAFVNNNPGRFVISMIARSLLKEESTAIAEKLFYEGGNGDAHVVGGSLIDNASLVYMLPGGLMDVGPGAFLKSPVTGTKVKVSGRAMLKPDFKLYDPAGTARWAAAEAAQITQLNSRFTGGDTVSVVVNGAEYQPYPKANVAADLWVKNTAYTVGRVIRQPQSWSASTVYAVGNMVRNSSKQYICTVGGTSASSGGPTGTGTGITDGSVTWDYSTQDRRVYICITAGTSENHDGAGPLTTAADITDGTAHWEYCRDAVTYWEVDDNTHAMVTAATAQPNTDPGNTAYMDAILGAMQDASADLYTAHKNAGVDTYVFYWPVFASEGILGSSRSDGRRQRSLYGPPYPYVVTPTVTTDYAGWEFYRSNFSSFSSLDSPNGVSFRGVTIGEYVLNAAAQNIEAGKPLMCPFVAGVYNGTADALKDDLYMGFIKFVYTAGCLGVVPGYYSVGPYNGTWTIGSGASDQVRQYCSIGHVHATFSHLENYLRSGTLLEGDYDAWGLGSSTHILSKNIYGTSNGFIHPSYEYAHNDTYQWYSKVIARKLDASNDWLICAWRCHDDGNDATLSVTIAGHALSVNARRGGTLYHMDNSGTLTMLDPLSMDPSRTIATILAGL